MGIIVSRGFFSFLLNLLHLANELNPHAKFADVGIVLEVPNVLHCQSDEHVEGYKGHTDDKCKEHAVANK